MESACQASDPSQPAPPDPLAELQRLRELNRRWRRGALAIGAAFVFLFFLSLVQFLGTLAASKFLKDAQRESSRMNRETADILRELRSTQQRLRLESKAAVKPDEPDAPAKVAAPSVAQAPQVLAREEQELKEPKKMRQQGEQQLIEAREKIEQQRIREERLAIKKLRDAGLPAGHEPDKNCPFPVK
jgi:hypothetical protein